MTGLVRLLGAILGRHIERDEVAAYVWPDEQAVAPVFDLEAAIQREHLYSKTVNAMHAEIDRQRTAVGVAPRPCWTCGHTAGFSGKHQCGRTWVRADGSTT